MNQKAYIAIDLKSFYASVECVERGVDPLKYNLVVADNRRTEKTICLAVSPSLKSFGIPGRPRLFEVVSEIKKINQERLCSSPRKELTRKSYNIDEIMKDPETEVAYTVATPRMALYTKYSTDIYNIYLKYVALEDIHIYSVDEVFIDATSYLKTYKTDAFGFADMIISDVLRETGITATVGIGTNLYLSKIAMDIKAKRMKPDKNGVRIAYLDEMMYRKEMWYHKPITDFWRVGKGYASRLEKLGLFTMGDIALCSVGKKEERYNEDLLYKNFGVNAELLIDHAWGWEPCTIADIKSYAPDNKSRSSGQVLQCPYTYEKAKVVTCEMADSLSLEFVKKHLYTNQIVLTIGYDVKNTEFCETQKTEIKTDRYGRKVPKHSTGRVNFSKLTSSTKKIVDSVSALYDEIVNRDLLIRRINISLSAVSESEFYEENKYQQIDFLNNNDSQKNDELKEREIQKTIIKIKDKFGKNSIIKGLNLKEGATGIKRNNQLGGHSR